MNIIDMQICNYLLEQRLKIKLFLLKTKTIFNFRIKDTGSLNKQLI